MVSEQYQLVMRTGPTMGKIYGLGKDEISIGRDPSNDIVINEAEVSRKHARLLIQDKGYMLEDLGSTNGTFINGLRLEAPLQLQPGDMVLLGENVSMTFELLRSDEASTIAVQPRPALADTPPAQPAYQPPQPERRAAPPPQPQPAYSGQARRGTSPLKPPEEPPASPEPSGRRTWLWAGCGCLVVVILILAVGAYAFDALNLYCVPPFDVLGRYLPVISWNCSF